MHSVLAAVDEPTECLVPPLNWMTSDGRRLATILYRAAKPKGWGMGKESRFGILMGIVALFFAEPAWSAPKLTDLKLVNYRGNCNSLRARFLDLRTKEFYGAEELAPCGRIPLKGPSDLQATLLARVAKGTTKLKPLPQSAASSQMIVRDRVGDCRATQLTVDDRYIGNQASYVISSPCRKVNLADALAAPANAIGQYVKDDVDPLLAIDMLPSGITFCDKEVDPGNIHSVLRGLQYSSRWMVVCLKPGTYQGPIRIENARNLVLWSRVKGAAKLVANVTLSPASTHASTLEIFRSRNVYLDGLHLQNDHVWTRAIANQNSTDEVSRALTLYTVEGLTLSRANVVSAGKQTVSMYYVDTVRFDEVAASGAYYIYNVNRGTFLSESGSIRQKHPTKTEDIHSTITSVDANMLFKNLYVDRITGHGFYAGSNDPAVAALYVHNVAFSPRGMDGWEMYLYEYSYTSSGARPTGYHGSVLKLTGSYPRNVPDYYLYCNVPGTSGCTRRPWYQVYRL